MLSNKVAFFSFINVGSGFHCLWFFFFLSIRLRVRCHSLLFPPTTNKQRRNNIVRVPEEVNADQPLVTINLQ